MLLLHASHFPLQRLHHVANRIHFVVLSVNFQSIRAKKSAFWLLLEESNPYIIIGSETWLYPGIFEREVLQAGYNIVAKETDNKTIMVVLS